MLCLKFLNDLQNCRQLNSHGNPVKTKPLINSRIPKVKEKTRKMNLLIFFRFLN